MTSTLPRMSTTMVKISTLASAVDTPADEALSSQPLSFREQFEAFASLTSKSISPQDAAAIMAIGTNWYDPTGLRAVEDREGKMLLLLSD